MRRHVSTIPTNSRPNATEPDRLARLDTRIERVPRLPTQRSPTSPEAFDGDATLIELDRKIKVLEDKASVYNALAKKINEEESECLKQLSTQKAALKLIMDKPYASQLQERLRYVETQFPKQPSLVLRLALGNGAPYSLRPLKLRIGYKRDYEMFKLGMTVVSTLVVLLCLFVTSNRVMDAIYEFLMLYYYCTIVLREHILVVNGSRIRKWWLGHHYFSIVLSGVVLTWPPGDSYHQFRPMFLWFCLFLCGLQYLQHRYQISRLYALVALDMARQMDTVVGDGVPSSSIDAGFMMLVPLLFCGHVWQIYISYTLYSMFLTGFGHEWQVVVVAILFAILGFGNFTATILTLVSRTKET